MTAARLKASILKLAVTGKLVPQDPAEGTGEELLREILAAKNAKGAKDKSKVAKSSSRPSRQSSSVTSVPPADAPFEIPANWVWCKLGDVVQIESNLVNPSDYHSLPHVAPDVIEKGTGRLFSCRTVEEDKVISPNHLFKKGQLLYSKIRPLLRKVVIAPFDGLCCSDMYPLSTSLDVCFVKYFLLSDVYNRQVKEVCSSRVKMPKINQVEMSGLLLPFPPLAEQKRIVARIEELMPLVEEYGKLEEKRLQLDADLPDALEKAILQDAIQGKLVPQDPAEGTAAELLREIQAAKNAKGAKGKTHAKSVKSAKASSVVSVDSADSVVPPEDPPFEIPSSWAWCKLGDLCDYGKCQSATNIPEGAWVLDLEDIEKDSGRLLRRVCSKERNSKSGKHVFRKGMVLYSKLRTYLNKVLVADEDGFCTSEIIPLDFGEAAEPRYARFVLMSPYFLEYTAQCGYGVKMPRLGTEDGRKALFPLPPLAEQKRIVAKVEQLLATVRKLKTEGDR